VYWSESINKEKFLILDDWILSSITTVKLDIECEVILLGSAIALDSPIILLLLSKKDAIASTFVAVSLPLLEILPLT